MNFDALVQYIKDYDSDTFHAESAELTNEEAVLLAERMIQNMVDHHMNGVMLNNGLEQVREDAGTESSEVEEEKAETPEVSEEAA